MLNKSQNIPYNLRLTFIDNELLNCAVVTGLQIFMHSWKIESCRECADNATDNDTEKTYKIYKLKYLS